MGPRGPARKFPKIEHLQPLEGRAHPLGSGWVGWAAASVGHAAAESVGHARAASRTSSVCSPSAGRGPGHTRRWDGRERSPGLDDATPPGVDHLGHVAVPPGLLVGQDGAVGRRRLGRDVVGPEVVEPLLAWVGAEGHLVGAEVRVARSVEPAEGGVGLGHPVITKVGQCSDHEGRVGVGVAHEVDPHAVGAFEHRGLQVLGQARRRTWDRASRPWPSASWSAPAHPGRCWCGPALRRPRPARRWISRARIPMAQR